MLFLSAQDITTYFLWQVDVCVNNLASKGIYKEQIHILFATQKGQQISKEDDILLKHIHKIAKVFFYEDERKEKKYLSSIRPHIIAKHFLKYPDLAKETIFYHDCDIIFRELPPLFNELKSNKTWYVSDTANYLESNYIKANIGEGNFIKMCSIVGVEPSVVIQQDANCGGAQYIMNNVNAAFWQKVERDCEAIYVFLQIVNLQNKIEEALKNDNPTVHGIQNWCADMWAVLWNALYFKHKVETHPNLDFSWPKDKIENWDSTYIFHNAGIDQKETEEYFYKGNYIYHTPFFENFSYVKKEFCSIVYADVVKKMGKDWQVLNLSDMTFLIPVMIDSNDRLDNLFTVVRYLHKHFQTNIIIYEYGKQQIVNPGLLPKGTKLLFEQGNNEIFYHTDFNNKLIDATETPFISIYDTDVIIPVSQILSAAYLLRNKMDMVYPYDGTFISMDKLSSVIFSKFLDDKFIFENIEKFGIASYRSFGGSVFLNRESYLQAGKENLNFTSWGPEDIERYHRMKILGFKIKRISGPLYHMYHERKINSGYTIPEKQVEFMEEYIKVFNMKKNELKKYVATW